MSGTSFRKESSSSPTIRTNKMIDTLQPGQIIVVGTNLNGNHYGGAAAQAHRDFGLEWGIAEGLSGQSYAFPTLDNDMRKCSRESLENSIRLLYGTCIEFDKKEFLLTPVGTGIAGFEPEYMKSLFKNPPKNLKLPEDWITN